MINIKNYSLAGLFMTLMMVITVAIASETKTVLPFGIRHYETGKAQNFQLDDIDGETFSLDSTKGKWVFLHFWASWCGPCREEMPAVQRMSEKMKGEPLVIVLVNTAEEEDDIFSFLGSIDVELNSLRDSEGQVTEIWKPRGLPTTFLIDPEGMVRYQAIGGRSWDQPEYILFLKSLLLSAK